MTELGQKNENVVALCADLIGSLKFDDFKKNHPERFFQIGIAEANMLESQRINHWWKNSFTGLCQLFRKSI
jgi:transketolase C-terminal domain/subunit